MGVSAPALPRSSDFNSSIVRAGKTHVFSPLALSLYLSRPSDERYLLDFIFGVFT